MLYRFSLLQICSEYVANKFELFLYPGGIFDSLTKSLVEDILQYVSFEKLLVIEEDLQRAGYDATPLWKGLSAAHYNRLMFWPPEADDTLCDWMMESPRQCLMRHHFTNIVEQLWCDFYPPEAYTDHKKGMKGTFRRSSVTFKELHDVALKTASKLEGMVLVGREYDSLWKNKAMLSALQCHLSTLDMSGWSDRSCDLAVNIVRRLLYKGQLKHLSIKHASLSESAWKRVLQLPELHRQDSLATSLENSVHICGAASKHTVANHCSSTASDNHDAEDTSDLFDCALAPVTPTHMHLRPRKRPNYCEASRKACKGKHTRPTSESQSKVVFIDRQNRHSGNREYFLEYHQPFPAGDPIEEKCEESEASASNTSSSSKHDVTCDLTETFSSDGPGGLKSVRFRDISGTIFCYALLEHLAKWIHITALELSTIRMSEQLTEPLDEALWHLVEHGSLDTLTLDAVGLTPSSLSLMNDIMHSSRSEPFKHLTCNYVADQPCNHAAVHRCLSGCPVTRGIVWVSFIQAGHFLKSDNDVRALRSLLDYNPALKRLDLDGWQIDNNGKVYPVTYGNELELTVDRSTWSFAHQLQLLPGLNLEMLRLSDKSISGEPLETLLLAAIKALSSLCALFVSSCSLRPAFVTSKEFVDVVIEHPSLYYLDLSENYLAEGSYSVLKAVLTSIKYPHKKWQLNLSGNQIQYDGLMTVAEETAGNRRRLAQLDLSRNSLSHPEARQVRMSYGAFCDNIVATSMHYMF